MKRVHTYLSSPFFIIIFLKLSCFDKKKKTTYNPINKNSFFNPNYSNIIILSKISPY